MNKLLIIPYLARRGQKKAALAPRDRYQVVEAILKKGGASSIKSLCKPRLWKTPLAHIFLPLRRQEKLALASAGSLFTRGRRESTLF
jgi:hypothetical protein